MSAIFYECNFLSAIAVFFTSKHFKGQCLEVFYSGLFQESSPPAPLDPLKSCLIFFIRKGFGNSRCTGGIVDTGGKFTAVIVCTAAENLPPVAI